MVDDQMNKHNQNTIVFCFGEGGHSAQANRLANIIIPLLGGYKIATLSDVKKKPAWSHQHYKVDELRSKHSHIDTIIHNSIFKIIRVIAQVSKEETVKAVISTGPGISLVAGIYFKLRGAKVIHIETWSRFKTTSLTGRLMYRVADKFYVQHRSLLELYPKGIYSGLL